MGTNYYMVTAPPTHRCNCSICPGLRETRTHLGKLSQGWAFSFSDPEGKWRPENAYAKWRERIQGPGVVEDEYGVRYGRLDFLMSVVMPTLVVDKRHAIAYGRGGAHGPADNEQAHCYMTPEGFSFSVGEWF